MPLNSVLIEALQEKVEIGTPNDEYENFVEAHLERKVYSNKT